MNISEKQIAVSNFASDLGTGLVVFIVTLPLCVGIALASGMPIFSGIITSIIGGLVIGILGKSQLSVAGPSAGLAAVLLSVITELGAFDIFLCTLIIAGFIQIALGFLKAGSIANFFPLNVVDGVLAGFGIVIFLKQIPHAIGYDADYHGDQSFYGIFGGNTFSHLIKALEYITPGALLFALITLSLTVLWEKIRFFKNISFLPGAIIGIVISVIINEIFIIYDSPLAVGAEHRITLPVTANISDFLSLFTLPNLAGFFNLRVWSFGFTIALITTIETSLHLEAVSRMDPLKGYVPINHELTVQGFGNILSGLFGGLPIATSITLSSINIETGAKTRASTIIHGLLLVISLVSIPFLLNRIPLAALSSILILTGYKLTKPALYQKWYEAGISQFVPFVTTALAIVFTDLLSGVAIGMFCSLFLILGGHIKSAYSIKRDDYREGDTIRINLAQEVSFLNKAAIKLTLEKLPFKSHVIIDATESVYIEYDVLVIIKDFIDIKAPARDIRIELVGFKPEYEIENSFSRAFVYSEYEDPKHLSDKIVHLQLTLEQEVPFSKKAELDEIFSGLPKNSQVTIDGSNTVFIDHNVLDLIKNFRDVECKERNITVKFLGFNPKFKADD